MTYDGSDLVVVVPLWKRATNIDRLLDSVEATVPAAEVLFVVNLDDADLGWAVMAPPGATRLSTPWGDARVLFVDWPGGTTGDYARKINAGYAASDRPVIFTGADDVEFTDGWYEMARPMLDVDHTFHVGVVGTVDDCNARTFSGDLSTHSLVARWYANLGTIDRPGRIYCEDYPHEYVDDELVETARSRGAYAHAFASVVRHHHPNAARAEMDATYAHGRARTRESRMIFQRRRRLWNPTNAQPGVTTISRPR